MTDDARTLVLAVALAAACAALGWFARGLLWRTRLRRKQAFFGLPDHAESMLVINREAGGAELTVLRHDVFALLELSGLIKECGALAQVVAHDAAGQGFGERTEFCVGSPAANRRTAAHLQSLLPGVRITTEPDAGSERGAFRIGTEHYRLEQGSAEHVLLARLTGGRENGRPVFLLCGQRAITHQAAARYLAGHHEKLARKHGGGSFVLLLKVVNSQAYGPDVVELVADVTQAAQAPAPAAPAKTSHRAK